MKRPPSPAAVILAAIAAPHIPREGRIELGRQQGTWSGSEPITYTYQWLRCNDNAQSCTKIAGATGTDYTIVKADVGHTI